jgi:glycosyltransferase involved in cell wall biosynthesis
MSSKTLKVRHVAPLPETRFAGGPTAIVRQMMKWQDEFEALGVSMSYMNSVVIERPNESQGRFTIDNLRNLYLLACRMVQYQQEDNVDFLQIHTARKYALLKDLLAIRYYIWKTGGRVLFHIHFAGLEAIFPNGILGLWAKKLLDHKKIDTIFLSYKDQEELRNSRRESYVLPNFHFKEEFAAESRTQNEVVRLLYLGALSKRKGYVDLLSALKNIDQSKYVLDVVGSFIDEETREAAALLIDENSLHENVVYHGYLVGDEKDSVVNSADVLVLPTYGEGMPVVILEALSIGLPIVTTPVGAIPEVLESEKDSLLFEPGDVATLQAHILKLLEDRQFWDELSRGALDKARQYTPQKFQQNLCEIIKSAEQKKL